MGARRADRKAPPKGAVAQRPGASRRSIPFMEGEKENGMRADPAPEIKEYGRRSVGCSSFRGAAKRANPESISTNGAITDRQGIMDSGFRFARPE